MKLSVCESRAGMTSKALIRAAVLLALSPVLAAQAQDTGTTQLEEIVIVGTPGGAGINKIEASFAVTTIGETAIEEASPKSTAELFTLVPGVWVESSGGVSAANIWVRGLPSTGDADFVTIQLEGSPIYGASTLSFFENSAMFRIDETVQSLEALRGGPATILTNGQPGLTANFRLKEGGEETAGVIKYSVSDYDLRRLDAMMSGKLADDLYYMIGGYTSTSPGIRDAQFESEKGQQFTAKLTKHFDSGKLSAYVRTTDDHGQWYLPFAKDVPGLNLGTYNQLGNFTRFRELGWGDGQVETFDFKDGRGFDGTIAGLNFEYEIGGWTIRNNFSTTKGQVRTLGFVPDGAAILATTLAAQIDDDVTTADGEVLGGSDYVQNWGHWVVLKEMQNLSNDLSFSYTAGSHDLTLGLYNSTFSSDDFWLLGNFTPVVVRDNGNFLDSGITCQDLADAGSGSGCWNYDVVDGGDVHMTSLYAADSWQITDQWRLDVGANFKQYDLNFAVDDGDIDGVVNVTRPSDIKDNEKVSWTAGVNYQFAPRMGTFLRLSRGYKFAQFDDVRGGLFDTAIIDQIELGLKMGLPQFQMFATLFKTNIDGAKFNDVGGVQSTASNKSYGLELDANWQSTFGLNVDLNATYQKSEIEKSSVPTDKGNQTARIPEMLVRLTPSYRVDFGADSSVTLYGSYSHVGDRYSDNANLQTLPSYDKIDIGAIVERGQVSFQLAVDNAGNSHGLTEGDPRPPVSGISQNARPILGRSARLTVGYRF